MRNKVILPRPLRKRLTVALVLLLVFTLVFAGTLLLLRAVSVKDYNGKVTEVTGELQEIIYVEDNNVRIIVNDVTYIANPVNRFAENLNLEELLHQTVTVYVSQTQVGKMPLVLGIKLEEQVLADYERIIELAQAENREVMITMGILAGICFAVACGVYVWRLRTAPTKEYDMAEKFAEFSMSRQPWCPEYKKYFLFMLIYLVVFVLLATTIGIVGECVDNETVQIAVGASLGGVIFISTIVLIPVLTLWLYKKERGFYVKNFPFDFTDVSHITMRKKFKEQLQAELREEREKYPHRYGDGGNYDFTLEFSDTGLKIYNFELLDPYDTPSTDDVFGIQDVERETKCLVCTMDYQTLNFEALPFYRKTHHPLTVVIKSRLDFTQLPDSLNPEEMNDLHIILDSNLLATLRHFNVPVENLDYILENKEQLIKENCARFTKSK